MVQIEEVHDAKITKCLICIAIVLLILNSINILFLKIIYLPSLILYLLLLVILASICELENYYSKKGRKCVENILKNQKVTTNKNHNAIVLLNSERKTFPFWGGVDVLIKAFEEKKCPFKIYCCNSIEEINSVLKNPYANSIWLFGHGWRGGFSLYKKKKIREYIKLESKVERISYLNLVKKIEDYPKKEFIAQFHCNHVLKNNDNISLPELLLADPSDYRNSYVSSYQMSSISTVIALKYKVIERIKCPT